MGFFKPEVKAEAMPAVKKTVVPVKKEVNQKDEAKKAHKQHQEDKDVEKQDALAQKLLKETLEKKLKKKLPELASHFDQLSKVGDKKDKGHNKKDELKEKITLAVLQILKEATEEVYSKFAGSLKSDKSFLAALKNSSNLEKVIVNTHLGAKGLFFTIGFNLGLVGADSGIKNSNIIKQGLAYTASDFSIGLLFKLGGGLEGPLNWGLVLVCAIDTLTYDKKTINALRDAGLDALSIAEHARREGHIFEALGSYQLAADRLRISGIREATHTATYFYDQLTNVFTSTWDKISSLGHKPVNMSSIRPYDDQHRFFGPKDDWKVGLPDMTNSSRKKV